jgi:carbamoyltransferase
MKIIGISPLDKDSTACLVEDGKVVAAIAEERLSRVKLHAGFPYKAMEEILRRHHLTANDIDEVVYSFFDWPEERRLMQTAVRWQAEQAAKYSSRGLFRLLRSLPPPPTRRYNIPGLPEENVRMKKPWYMELAYRALGANSFLGTWYADRQLSQFPDRAGADHCHWSEELNKGLREFSLQDKLSRVDHHLTHAANAYLTSGFDEALIVTLDGYGSGLAGSVSVGKGGSIERLHALSYPTSLGEFYEKVTSSLGFKPGRHEGKIVGLAAYDDPDVLYDTVRSMFEVNEGEIYYRLPHNLAITRYLASNYAKPTVAAAYQKVLERVTCDYVSHYVRETRIPNVVLSGGVVANVKANQRIFEIDGVERIFVHPNMGDGGCSVGAALWAYGGRNGGAEPHRLSEVYWGPGYAEGELRDALKDAGLAYESPEDPERRIAELIAGGNIVARFNGRMEYGPRALGNRSILYHANDPSVNLWLNQQLGRTEFMPFAPATLFEARHKCYKHVDGADYSAQFMTITFDCTEFMIRTCPAAVHVDGTARPQLVTDEGNPSFYRIIQEYERITGIPSVINTSFNMHEEPIVCTPQDAIRAFKLGHLPYLAMGPFIAKGHEQASIGHSR